MTLYILNQGTYSFNECLGDAGFWVPGMADTEYFNGTGWSGLISKCRIANTIFYLMEYYALCSSFYISANERWGLKYAPKPDPQHQVLKLQCPSSQFPYLAQLVNKTDELHRRVIKSNFSAESIEQKLKRKPIPNFKTKIIVL